MIGKIKGSLTELIGSQGLIETAGGVGYLVHLPAAYFGFPLPHEIELYTYHHVREDAQVLYGFESIEHMKMFQVIYGIAGVGPKTAFSVVTFGSPARIGDAVRNNDLGFFTSIPGLGKKTAMKLVLELASKLKEDIRFDALHLNESDEGVLQALQSLGFAQQDARQILPEIPKELPIEERITEGIRLLTSKKPLK